MAYDRFAAVGATGLFDDWGTTAVDEAALNGWNNFLSKYKVGDLDPYNNQGVSKEERNAAKRGASLFSMVVAYKKKGISDFMNSNYANEAQYNSSSRYGKVSNKKQRCKRPLFSVSSKVEDCIHFLPGLACGLKKENYTRLSFAGIINKVQ